MWLAIMTCAGKAHAFVTVELKTNFLRSTSADIGSAATVVRYGRRIALGTAETIDSCGRITAHTSLAYVRANQIPAS